MTYCILRVSKLKSMGAIAGSCAHTFRDVDTPNADSRKTAQNASFGATSTRAVLSGFRNRLPDKRRKDAVLGLEYLITASPSFFENGNQRRQYFVASLAWLNQKHGPENVISTTVHLDETSPHMIVYVVPLTKDGRLAAKDYVGGITKLSKMQSDFHSAVGVRFGLKRGEKGSRAKHQSVKNFYTSLNKKPAQLPELRAFDHVAAAAGFQTDQMIEFHRSAAHLRERASQASQNTLLGLEKKVATLSLEANHYKAAAKKATEEVRFIATAKDKESSRLKQQVAQLEAQLYAAKTEIQGWISKIRTLAKTYQLPWVANKQLTPNISEYRRKTNAP